jgi:hypothetical protein
MQFLSVLGVYDYARTGQLLALAPLTVLPSPSVDRVGVPN